MATSSVLLIKTAYLISAFKIKVILIKKIDPNFYSIYIFIEVIFKLLSSKEEKNLPFRS